MKPLFISIIGISMLILLGFNYSPNFNYSSATSVGQKIDSLNGVYVFDNGGVSNLHGRNIAADGYNLGLKYQCVEFVKRYYYEYFNHKMPDSYGHAKDFFDPKIADGKINKKRNLIQFSNPSFSKPQINDILIFKGYVFNKFGHVAIVSKVTNNQIEIIQQNPGPLSGSREIYNLENKNEHWKIDNNRILGWLRK